MKAYLKNKIRDIKLKLTGIRSKPAPVCLGYALGIFLAATPFIGVKVPIAIFFTHLFRWSKVASIVGVFHINIVTGPIFYGLSFIVGKYLTGTNVDFTLDGNLSVSAIFHMLSGNISVFTSLLVGGAVIGLPASVAAYFLSMKLMKKAKTEPAASSIQHPVSSIQYQDANPKPCTLITGASQGLGREIAIECARRGQDLVLVALPGRNMDAFCTDIARQFGIRAWYYETDLTDKDAIVALVGEVLASHRVNFLVNNAGAGGTVPFDSSSLEYLDNIIQLNIRALSMLTRMLVPELKSHPKAFILNISSMAAFSPLPYKTVYPASKAFVTSFSRSLNRELRGTSVRVAAVHPGPILTNPDVTLRIIRQGTAGKVGLLRASEIARIAVDGIRRGKEVIVPGIMNKFNLFLIRIVPEQIRLNLVSKVIRREISTPLMKAA